MLRAPIIFTCARPLAAMHSLVSSINNFSKFDHTLVSITATNLPSPCPLLVRLQHSRHHVRLTLLACSQSHEGLTLESQSSAIRPCEIHARWCTAVLHVDIQPLYQTNSRSCGRAMV